MQRESSIEHPCCVVLEQYGWTVVKVGREGYPDRLAIKRKHCFWLEFKTPKGSLTKAQQRRIPKLQDEGQLVLIVDNVDALRVALSFNHYPFNSF